MIVVPYHQDQRLPDDQIPSTGGVPPGASDPLMVDPVLPDADIWRRLVALDHAAAEQIAASVRGDRYTTVASGDCLTALAALAGAQRAGVHPSVVWFDAHGDLHTLDSTASGYLGGLSLRLVTGAHPELLARPLGVQPVTEDRVMLVGARDLDPPEATFLRTSPVRRGDVATLDPATLPDGPLLVHIDLDVTDPEDLPGLLFPVPGGPRGADVVAAVRRIAATGRVAVLSLACTWHPTSDPRVRTVRARLLSELAGENAAAADRR